jgi:beta-xylosidase
LADFGILQVKAGTMKYHRLLPLFYLLMVMHLTIRSQAWVSDRGDLDYRNPVIFADYSDPDVVRVGKDFFMVSSSFNCVPGLPVLHSRDLVNWQIVNHVFSRMPPDLVFSRPQHGNGCWAPSIRFHEGMFYVFFGDPDYGIYMSRSRDPLGPWEDLQLIWPARGWIDPCPLWDDDGNAYLVHAFAGSRSGMKSVLVVHRMKPDGSGLLGEGVLVYDGHGVNPTIEGPKFYKRNGYYYIFAPAGGVTTGWQTVLRSRDPFGPYEIRTVMQQGSTDINGPHQGGWVELENGQSWFLHFQDRGAYGRVVHLNPLEWVDDWPVIGTDEDGDGTGEPVLTYRKPEVDAMVSPAVPQTSDEFEGSSPGLQWQWHANPRQEWMFLSGNLGFMRLYCMQRDADWKNHWDTPNLYLQKFPAPVFTATTLIRFEPFHDGDRAGLIIMGMDYAAVALEQKDGKLMVSRVVCRDAAGGTPEKVTESHEISGPEIFLRAEIGEGGRTRFGFSTDGTEFNMMEGTFTAVPGKWIGAKVGLFAQSTEATNDKGFADVNWFRIQ